MNQRYLFIRIGNPGNDLAVKLAQRFDFSPGYHFESSQGPLFELSYNRLFEREGEYTSSARMDVEHKEFLFKSDFWNILAHYVYNRDGVLILSNDPLLIAALTGAAIDPQAVWDCLIFGRPYKSGTYFERIRKLTACKQGVLDLSASSSELICERYPYWRDMLADYRGIGLAELFKADFAQVKQQLGNEEVALQFSGGSDSVTLFNAFRYFDIRFSCVSYSWKPETNRHIKRFCRHFKVPYRIYETREGEETLKPSLRLSAGLAPTTRFTSLFSQIAPVKLFDGYAFVKGDMSDAFIHPVFGNLLKMKGIAGIAEVYPEMRSEQLRALYDHWLTKYAVEYGDVNTSEGLHKYQDYAMDYIGQNIVGPHLTPAMQMLHQVNTYYITVPYVLAYFNQGSGFSSTVSIRKDYVGYRRNLKELADINSKLDAGVYAYHLDKHLSFKEINEWTRTQQIGYYLRRYRASLVKRMKGRRPQPIRQELPFMQAYGIANTRDVRLEFLDTTLAALRDMVKSGEVLDDPKIVTTKEVK